MVNNSTGIRWSISNRNLAGDDVLRSKKRLESGVPVVSPSFSAADREKIQREDFLELDGIVAENYRSASLEIRDIKQATSLLSQTRTMMIDSSDLSAFLHSNPRRESMLSALEE